MAANPLRPSETGPLANQHKGKRHDITNAGFIERNWSAAARRIFSRRRTAAAAGTRGSACSARRARGSTRIDRAIHRSFSRPPAVERAVVINRTSIGRAAGDRMIVMNHLLSSSFRLSRQAAQIIFSAALLTATVENWRGLKKGLFDPYRPELHYMRGPGPKWHEAHRHADSN